MEYYHNESELGVKAAVAAELGLPISEVEMGHDGTGYFIVRPEGANPDPAAVAAQAPPPPPPSEPLTDVDIARQYASAYQAAEDIIFLLMARVSMGLIGAGLFTPETVNGEGTRFVFFHRAKIEAFKLAGRHPDAGDALYAAIMAPESIGAFSWLEGPIGQIFATGLPRNP